MSLAKTFNEKDQFIKAALFYALKDTTAISDLDYELSGRENWFELCRAYMGKDSEEFDTSMALKKLQKLVLNRRSRHSPEAFAAKFVKIMKVLDRNEMGYPEKLRKKIFLNKILDERFCLWKANSTFG